MDMSGFKKFLFVWTTSIAVGLLLLVGGFSLLYHGDVNEDQNIVASQNHFSVHWLGFDPPEFSDQYPDYYVCVNNLKDTTLTMNIALKIINQEMTAFYFRIAQNATPPAGWTLPNKDLGSLAVGYTWTGTYSLNRTKPTSITAGRLTESVDIAIKAYYDSGYTNLYSQDNFTATYHLIDRTAGVWTTLYNNNFDDGTVQGWWRSEIGTHTQFGSVAASSAAYRSYPHSLGFPNSAGGTGYAKSFAVPVTYQEAYLIFSVRNYWSYYSPGDARIFLNGTEYFRTDVGPSNYLWYQFSIPLPTNKTTTVELYQMYWANCYLDDVYVVAK